MGTNFHTPYTSGTTFKPESMNPPFSELDKALTYLKNVIIGCDGVIEYEESTGVLSWDDDIEIIFNRENGDAIKNIVSTGNITLSDNEFAYADLSETNNQVIAISKASISTGTASNFITFNRIVLGYRNAESDAFYPVLLKSVWGQAGTAKNFIQLKDTPSNYSGDGLKLLRVNAGENAIEFATITTHAQDHGIDSTADHDGVAGATENNLISFNADALPKDSGIASSDVSTAITKSQIYDIACTSNGMPGSGAVILRIPFVRSVTFPVSMTGSQGVVGIAPTNQADFDLQKNGVSFGTMRFAAAASTATFISAAGASFVAGNVLTVVAPNPQDATLQDLGFILTGTK